MGRKKKDVIVDEVNKQSVIEDKIVEQTIYDKYAKYIDQANAGYLVGLSYNDKIEILRYCEKKIGAEIPMNLNCGVCVIDLIKLFVRLKDK